MPGRRNLARERATHDAPATFARLHTMLVAALPAHDRALVGHRAILDFLHALHVRRPSGRPLSWRMVRRWRLQEGFPFLPGTSLQCRPAAASPMTTTYLVTAWLVSRFSSMDHRAFRVSLPPARDDAEGSALAKLPPEKGSPQRAA